jgi:hypothetical protein
LKIEVIGNKSEMKPILEQFCEDLESEFSKTKVKWDKRLKMISHINPLSAGYAAEIPDMAFAVLDTDEPDKLIFFHSAPTPILHRVLKMPIKRMERMLEGYCFSKNVKVSAKWIE